METAKTTQMPSKVRQCPACKKQYPAEYDFCPDDAARLVPSDAPSVQPGSSTSLRTSNNLSASRQFSKATIIGLAIGLIVIFGAVFAALYRSHSVQSQSSQTPPVSASASQTVPIYQAIPANAAASNNAVAPVPGSTPATEGTGLWKRYQNTALGFSLDYPATWTADAPTNDGTTILVLFRSPDPHIVLLVDVDAPASGSTPLARWQGFDQRFARAYKDRYRLLSLGDAQLAGSPAAKWLFTVQKKHEPNLEKVDISATHQGKDFALLGSAPVASYPQWQGTFEHAAQSFAWTN